MSNFENRGPAFPSNRDMRYEQEFDREGGMSTEKETLQASHDALVRNLEMATGRMRRIPA